MAIHTATGEAGRVYSISHYLNAVAENCGCPTIIRADFATENVLVRDM